MIYYVVINKLNNNRCYCKSEKDANEMIKNDKYKIEKVRL